MQDFNSYTNGGQNVQDVNDEAKETLNEFAKKYEGATENELIGAILKEAKRRREAGTLTNEQVDYFASVLTPMLDANQKKQLDKIVKLLKTNQ